MSNKITFSKIVEELASQTGSSQTLSHDFVSGLTNMLITNALDSGKASLTSFGSFTVVDVAARNGVNPQSGETIVIPAHKRLSFSPYKALEKRVNAPFSNLEATVIEEEEDSPSSVKPETSAPLPLPSLSKEETPEVIEEEQPSSEAQEDKEPEEAPVFKRPGKEDEQSGNFQNAIILIVVLILVVLGLWYFVFRDTPEPQITEQQTPPPVEVPADPTPNPPPVVDQTATDSDTPEEVPVQEEAPVQQESVNVVDESSSEPVTYVVSRDEWIYDIARRTYSKPAFWPLIFEANFSVSQDPDLIIPGKTLTLPEIEDPQNPTQNDRARLAAAHRVVSEAYANAGKSDQAKNYERMAARFSN